MLGHDVVATAEAQLGGVMAKELPTRCSSRTRQKRVKAPEVVRGGRADQTIQILRCIIAEQGSHAWI